MDKQNLIFLVGVPGCGKSTMANVLEDRGHIVLSSDALIDNIAYSLNKTYSDVFHDIADAATKRFEADLFMSVYCNMPVVIDRTNLTVKSRKRTLGLIKQFLPAYTLTAIYFENDRDVLIDRLTKRNTTGKVISEKLLDSMLSAYERPTFDEGFDQILNHHAVKNDLGYL